MECLNAEWIIAGNKCVEMCTQGEVPTETEFNEFNYFECKICKEE